MSRRSTKQRRAVGLHADADRREAQRAAVLAILGAAGCSCECDDAPDHDVACERCLGCRIEKALTA